MSPPARDTTTVIDGLDADVRCEVRRRGVDPPLDVDAVRQMAATAVQHMRTSGQSEDALAEPYLTRAT